MILGLTSIDLAPVHVLLAKNEYKGIVLGKE